MQGHAENRRGRLSHLRVQSLPHLDRADGDGNRAVAVIDRHERVTGAEVGQMVLERNDSETAFDPTIGGVERVDGLFAIVIVLRGKIIIIIQAELTDKPHQLI